MFPSLAIPLNFTKCLFPGQSNSRRALVIGLSVAAGVILLIAMFVLYFRCCRRRGVYDTRSMSRKEFVHMSEVSTVC